jgi:uncharacterized membrane protein
MANEKTKTGLPRNTAAALSYVFGPVSGVVFLLLEKDPFIRFHAAQSIVVLGGVFVFWMLTSMFYVFFPIFQLCSILLFILWLALIYRSWQGDEWEVPFLGKYARILLKKAEKV